MKFPETYPFLKQNQLKSENYALVPIRYEDRFNIMQWRNEQIYHLRQDKPLTKDAQEAYFSQTVSDLFQQKSPKQILFSYLKKNICIGYGGLVHINWLDKHAEVSFIMDTSLEKEGFHAHWKRYLSLLEQVAFKDLGLHKLFVYAFDLRPHLYEAIEAAGFQKEAVLKEHCFVHNDFKDVIIHTKFNIYDVRK